MNNYKIEANAIESFYKGETKQEALDNYAKDAGYNDFKDLQEKHPAEVHIKQVTKTKTSSIIGSPGFPRNH